MSPVPMAARCCQYRAQPRIEVLRSLRHWVGFVVPQLLIRRDVPRCPPGKELQITSVPDRLEMLFQRRAQVGVLRRQLERLAQMRSVLVAVEARFVRRDLEQHPARRAEVDRPEIVPVY